MVGAKFIRKIFLLPPHNPYPDENEGEAVQEFGHKKEHQVKHIKQDDLDDMA